MAIELVEHLKILQGDSRFAPILNSLQNRKRKILPPTCTVSNWSMVFKKEGIDCSVPVLRTFLQKLSELGIGTLSGNKFTWNIKSVDELNVTLLAARNVVEPSEDDNLSPKQVVNKVLALSHPTVIDRNDDFVFPVRKNLEIKIPRSISNKEIDRLKNFLEALKTDEN